MNVGLFEFHKAGDAIASGWEAADKALTDIKTAQDALA